MRLTLHYYKYQAGVGYLNHISDMKCWAPEITTCWGGLENLVNITKTSKYGY